MKELDCGHYVPNHEGSWHGDKTECSSCKKKRETEILRKAVFGDKPEFDWYGDYWVSGKVLVVYREIQKRLYSEKSINGDEMRDMANRMDACLTEFQYDKLED